MRGFSCMFLLFSTLKIFANVTKSSCTLLTASIDHMMLFITCRFFNRFYSTFRATNICQETTIFGHRR